MYYLSLLQRSLSRDQHPVVVDAENALRSAELTRKAANLLFPLEKAEKARKVPKAQNCKAGSVFEKHRIQDYV
jgi:hypothetical protein